jgi:hypothetical protein
MTRREVMGIRLGVGALAAAALAAAVIGWLDGAPGSYRAFAAIWSTGAVVALSIGIVAGAELVASRDRAREFVRFQSRVGDALARSSRWIRRRG